MPTYIKEYYGIRKLSNFKEYHGTTVNKQYLSCPIKHSNTMVSW